MNAADDLFPEVHDSLSPRLKWLSQFHWEAIRCHKLDDSGEMEWAAWIFPAKFAAEPIDYVMENGESIEGWALFFAETEDAALQKLYDWWYSRDVNAELDPEFFYTG